MQFVTSLSLDFVLAILVGMFAVRHLERRIENWPSAKLQREFKTENTEMRREIRRVEEKVDAANQRLARLEGIILAREDMVDTIANTPQ